MYVLMNDEEISNLRIYIIIDGWSGVVIWVLNIIINWILLLSLVPFQVGNI